MGDEETILQAMKDAGKPLRPSEIADLTGLPKDIVSKASENAEKRRKSRLAQMLPLRAN